MGVFSNDEILEGIRRKDRAMISHIYDTYIPVLRNMVKSQGGNENDVRDIFQDSMMIIYDKIRKDELILDCVFGTYLYGIWRNLWLKTQKKRRLAYQREKDPELMMVEEGWRKEEEDTFEEEHYLLVRKHLEKLDPACRELMTLHMKSYSYSEIREIMGFDDDVQVRKKKHRCKEKLKRWIRKDAYFEILLKRNKK